MKHFKRILMALFIVSMVFLAVACGNKKATDIGIEVYKKPTKTVYTVGETFDPQGMVVVVVNDKGEIREVSGYKLDKKVLKVTDTKVGIYYTTFSTTLPITVNPLPDTGIQVTIKPEKLTYLAGEEFDPSGMRVDLIKGNGNKEQIFDYTIDKTVLSEEDTKVTISYKTFKTTLNIKVQGFDKLATVFTYRHNTAVFVEGIVYEIGEFGFYLYDGADYIYVKYENVATSELAIGDKVQLEAKYSYVAYLPQIVDIQNLTIVSHNNELPEPIKVNLTDVYDDNGLTPSSYARLVKMTGYVGRDDANKMYLADANNNSMYFTDDSNTSNLSSLIDTRVTAVVIVATRTPGAGHDGEWKLFIGLNESVTEASVIDEDILDADINMPSELYHDIVLPTGHKTLTDVAYAWSTTSEYLSINDNVLHLVKDAVEHEVTLKVTATKGEHVVDRTYHVTIKTVNATAISELLDNHPAENGSEVSTYGIVVSRMRNQSGNIFGVILQDPTTLKTMIIQLDQAQATALNVGDFIKVVGKWDEPYKDHSLRIKEVTTLDLLQTNVYFTHDYENAIVLETQADYTAYTDMYETYAADGALVKIVNPYMKITGSGNSRWIQVSYNGTKWNKFSSATTYYYAFQEQALYLTLGKTDGLTWWNDLVAAHPTETVFKAEGLVIYCYLGLYGSTYAQFLIPSVDLITMPSGNNVASELAAAIPTTVEPGQVITLPATADGFDVVWSSTDGNINVTTGIVSECLDETISELVATVSGAGTFKFNITIQSLKTLVQTELTNQMVTEVGSGETITLPDTIRSKAITWISTDGNIDVATGVVANVSEVTLSELKATVAGVDTFAFNITINPIDIEAMLLEMMPEWVNGSSHIDLPEKVNGKDIAWSTTENIIDVDTGSVHNISDSVVTILRATVEGYGTYEIPVNVIALSYVEIGDLRFKPTGTYAYIRGVVVGMSTSNQAPASIELLLKDEDSNSIIGVTGLNPYVEENGDYLNFGKHIKDFTYSSGSTVFGTTTQDLTWGTIKLGDVLYMPIKVSAPGTVAVYADYGKIKVAFVGDLTKPLSDYRVAENGNTAIDKTDSGIITISSQTDLQNFMIKNYIIDGTSYATSVISTYQIVKLSGTIKGVCYNGSSTAANRCPFIRFFFEASSVAEQRFANKLTVGIGQSTVRKYLSPCFLTPFNNMSFASGSIGENVFAGQGWTESYSNPLSFTGDLYCVYVGGQSTAAYGCFIILGESSVVAA